jgi:hypothetical protein
MVASPGRDAGSEGGSVERKMESASAVSLSRRKMSFPRNLPSISELIPDNDGRQLWPSQLPSVPHTCDSTCVSLDYDILAIYQVIARIGSVNSGDSMTSFHSSFGRQKEWCLLTKVQLWYCTTQKIKRYRVLCNQAATSSPDCGQICNPAYIIGLHQHFRCREILKKIKKITKGLWRVCHQ